MSILRKPNGCLYGFDIINAHRLGRALSVLASAAGRDSQLRDYLTAELATLQLDDAAYAEHVEQEHAHAVRYIEGLRRIRVDLMTGDPQANEAIDGYDTTVSAFLAKNGERFEIDHDDIAYLGDGEHFSYRDADGCQNRITRIADEVRP